MNDKIKAGDVAGHEFHGNQWTEAEASKASDLRGSADEASGKAFKLYYGTGKKFDEVTPDEHRAIAAAEKDAAQKYKAAAEHAKQFGNKATARVMREKMTYHNADAWAHEKFAKDKEAAAVKGTDMKKIISDIVKATEAAANKLDAAQAEATLKAALAGDTAAQGMLAALLKQEWPVIQAAGTSTGAVGGHATRKTASADKASQAAHEASAKAHESGEDADHEAAQVSHEIAGAAHKKAMLAHAKAGDSEQAGYHATAMAAHDACADAHGGDDKDTVTAALQKLGDVVKAGAPMGNQNAAGEHKGWTHRDYYGNRRTITKEDLAAHNAGREEPSHNENYNAEKKLGTMEGRTALKVMNKWDNKEPGAKVKIEKLDTEDRAAHIYDEHDSAASKTTASATAATNLVTAARDIVHCRASGSKLRADAAPDWAQDVPVEFCYMPGGLHTINAGFCGPITKGRAASINLTLDVDPDRDAAVCQASAESLKADAPKQDIYGCYEHDEKKASVWAKDVDKGIFKSGVDPVHQEPCILLAAVPSGDGAADVNKKNWRSWSPSFSTNAEYTKCKCSRCEENISVCACDKPQFYFPPEARGSAEKPAQITGIDAVLGTLTNKPAFRAMPPVRAREQDGTVTAGATTQPAPDDLDAILARAVPLESLDTILAKYEQAGVRVIGYAAELDEADAILIRISTTVATPATATAAATVTATTEDVDAILARIK